MAKIQSTSPHGRVFVLDTDASRAAELGNCLRTLNYEPVTPQPAKELADVTEDSGIAVMLGDMTSGQGVGRAFHALSTRQPELPVLCVAGTAVAIDIDDELHSYHTWELDFPLDNSQLARLLRRAERYHGQERHLRLTGTSKSIRDVRKLIEQVADFKTSVLISGDSGTGKELVARTIHELSDRSAKPFVPINCGAIPSELMESELFGHEKGAFTGAIGARKGRFELAQGGTLFLDEIGDMSLPMQTKLLRVLQERMYERVGGTKTRNCDVRIVAATHRDLPSAISKGEFREDLYYRLNVFPIEMPPLRKRAGDLPALIAELLLQHQGEGQDRLRLTADAMRALLNYSWPGNIRELSNLVERLVILNPTGQVGLSDLPNKYRQYHASGGSSQRLPNSDFDGLNLKEYLQNMEKDFINLAMQDSGGVVAKAARLLNLRRTTLVEKLARHGLIADRWG